MGISHERVMTGLAVAESAQAVAWGALASACVYLIGTELSAFSGEMEELSVDAAAWSGLSVVGLAIVKYACIKASDAMIGEKNTYTTLRDVWMFLRPNRPFKFD